MLADHLPELDAGSVHAHRWRGNPTLLRREYRGQRGLFLSIDEPDETRKPFNTLGLGPEDVDLIAVHRCRGDPGYR